MSLMLTIIKAQMKKQPSFLMGEGVDYEAQLRVCPISQHQPS